MKIKASILRFRESVKFALTLFVAPLTIALIADIIIQTAKRANVPLWQWLITGILVLVFALLLLAGYTNKFNRLAVSLESKLRARRFAKPSVLVLDGKLGEGHEIPPKPQITDYLPMDWARVLAEQAPGWIIELGPVEKLQAHQIIINPFGETYPEQDPYNYTTFSQICRYVENGGVFVNVSGRKKFHAVETGVAIVGGIHTLYKDSLKFRDRGFDRLAGTPMVRLSIIGGMTAHDIAGSWSGQLKEFEHARKKALLYLEK